jgi:hypothetical protein
MAGWTFKWLFWIALYLVPVILLPWAMAHSWNQQHAAAARFSPSGPAQTRRTRAA